MPELQVASNTAGVLFRLDSPMAGKTLVLPNVTCELRIQMLLKTDLRTLLAATSSSVFSSITVHAGLNLVLLLSSCST